MITDLVSRNKVRIAQQFSRAASTYNAAADVQLDIARDAMAFTSSQFNYGLDIGCGTGRISQQLASRCHKLIAMDIAFGMLAYAEQHNVDNKTSLNWLQGDADNMPVADNSIDLVFSSMALQWSTNQQVVLSEIARVMAKNSQAVLAIMCDGSFSQLNDSWKIIDSKRHVNHFATANSWFEAAKSQGLRVKMQEKTYITWHSNIRELLLSIKSIGANVLLSNEPSAEHKKSSPKNQLNRQTLQQLERQYQQKYAENMQLPLTYQVCFLQCSKGELNGKFIC